MRHGGLSRRRRHRRVAMAGGMVAALTAGSGVLYWAWPAAVPYRTTAGVDEGHGRGMSQFGAFDQAKSGTNAIGILQRYYPGAQLATIAPTAVRVRLMGQDDKPLDVYSDSGLSVAGRNVLPGQVAHLTPTSGGADVTVLSGCGGDVLWQGSTADPWVYPIAPGANRPAAEQLKICGAGGYRGALGVALDGQEIRTVDRVDTEDYLRGVVPTEMSADWADQGGGEALRAQAIAARSYALAETRYPYAQTCDTQDCQAYSGTSREDPRTDADVRATAGQVLLRDGHLLRTEYSSAPNGVHPMDAGMFEIGPTPAELTPAAPLAPADPPAPEPAPGPHAIDTKYAQPGGPTGTLGPALGPESLLPGRGGTFRLFRNGVIIATPTLGTKVVDFTTLLQLAPGVATPAAAANSGTPVDSNSPVGPASPANSGSPAVPGVSANSGGPAVPGVSVNSGGSGVSANSGGPAAPGVSANSGGSGVSANSGGPPVPGVSANSGTPAVPGVSASSGGSAAPGVSTNSGRPAGRSASVNSGTPNNAGAAASGVPANPPAPNGTDQSPQTPRPSRTPPVPNQPAPAPDAAPPAATPNAASAPTSATTPAPATSAPTSAAPAATSALTPTVPARTSAAASAPSAAASGPGPGVSAVPSSVASGAALTSASAVPARPSAAASAPSAAVSGPGSAVSAVPSSVVPASSSAAASAPSVAVSGAGVSAVPSSAASGAPAASPATPAATSAPSPAASGAATSASAPMAADGSAPALPTSSPARRSVPTSAAPAPAATARVR